MFKPRQKIMVRPDYEAKPERPGMWRYRGMDSENEFREGIITAKCKGPYYAVRFDDGYTDKIHEKDIFKHSRAIRALYVNPKSDLQSESGESASWYIDSNLR